MQVLVGTLAQLLQDTPQPAKLATRRRFQSTCAVAVVSLLAERRHRAARRSLAVGCGQNLANTAPVLT